MTAAFSQTTRRIVRERAAGKCELCGLPCPVGHYHHRKPRGMGGTKRIEASGAANCLLVHPTCHRDIEMARHRSLENGWLVRQSETPSQVRVKRFDGWTLLSDDGTLTPSLSETSSAAPPDTTNVMHVLGSDA